MLRVLSLVFWLLGGVFLSEPALAASANEKSPDQRADQEKIAPASPAAVNFVKLFLKTPTEELPPERIPEFIKIKADSLPAKLRVPYLAKKEELLALKKMVESRKRPPVRRAGEGEPPPNSCLPDPPRYLTVLPTAGFAQITDDEEKYLQEKVKCTECELIVEFTLRKVEKPKRGRGKSGFVYFLHEKDPLNALVGGYRAGIKNPFGTNFFGTGNPTCH